MCAALSNNPAQDGRAAHRARLTSALVNPKIILKFAPAVDPIDANPVLLGTVPDLGFKEIDFKVRFEEVGAFTLLTLRASSIEP